MSSLRPARSIRRRALAFAGIAMALPLAAGPMVQTASAERKTPVKPVVTCAGWVTGHPGDVHTTTSVIVFKGRVVRTMTASYICGDDGNWHTVA